MFCKIGVVRNFASLFLNKVAEACNCMKKETLAQVFSCEFCEISKNTFFYRLPLVAASGCCPQAYCLPLVEFLESY